MAKQKVMEVEELRGQSTEELEAIHMELCGEIYALRNEGRGQKSEKPHKIKVARKKVARLLTVLQERKGQKGKP